MVYESDFYTTRRPYRPSLPIVTNSNATIRPISPIQQQQVYTIPHHLPYIAHKKLVHVIHTPYPVLSNTHSEKVPMRLLSRLRSSVIAAELQRIKNRIRPSSISYVSRYLNSKDNILFDDEAREIRARADSLLRRIHVFVPRPSSSDFAEVIVPERMRSDDYIRRVIEARKNTKKSDEPANWYELPEHRQFGSGNLAAISYTGGKPVSRRKPYYKVADLRSANVQNDVNLLSFYAKNRQAAASAYPNTMNTDQETQKEKPEHLMTKKESSVPESGEKYHLIHDSVEIELEKKEKFKPSKKEAVESIVEPSEQLLSETKTESKSEPTAEHKTDSNQLCTSEVIDESKVKDEIHSTSETTDEKQEPPQMVMQESEEVDNQESELVIDSINESTEVEKDFDTDIHDDEPFFDVKSKEILVEQDPVDPSRLDCLESENLENDQKDNDVLQRKLDEEELRRQVEELKRQVEMDEQRQAEEARLAEKRWKEEIEERVRLEEEARQIRLKEIEEQEGVEAIRQVEESKIIAERLQEEFLAEEERHAAEVEAASALEEEERAIIEKTTEEARKRQEQEEKLVSEIALGLEEEVSASESKFDECQCKDTMSFQDFEERTESPDADDDTQIEEEVGCTSVEHEESEQLYDGEHEGFNDTAVVDVVYEHTITVDESKSDSDSK